MKSDERLMQEVKDELHWNPHIDTSHIDLSVRNGTVTVSGVVPTCAQKLAVEKAVRRVAGDEQPVVELRVAPDAAHTQSDEAVAVALTSVLRQTKGIPPDAICASVEHGCVTLAGEVDEEHQRQAAEIVASHVRGVVGVINQIAVKRDRRRVERSQQTML